MGLKPASVDPPVRAFTLSNIKISLSRLIEIKFYLKHHRSVGMAALCLGPDQVTSATLKSRMSL